MCAIIELAPLLVIENNVSELCKQGKILFKFSKFRANSVWLGSTHVSPILSFLPLQSLIVIHYIIAGI